MLLKGNAPRRLESTCRGILDVLWACQSLSEGRQIHAGITSQGLDSHPLVQSKLVQMYLKCGSLKDARMIFDGMIFPNVVLCTMMIGALGRNGGGAFQIFGKMLVDGTTPDIWTFVAMIAACGDTGDVAGLKRLHVLVADEGDGVNGAVGNALVNMYGRCGLVAEATGAFRSMRNRGVLGWNALIAAYAQNGHCREAFATFCEMLQEGEAAPNRNTFVVCFDGFEDPAMLHACRILHSCAWEAGHGKDPVLSTALINVYGNCGSFEEARQVFEETGNRDVITWTAIITAAFLCEQVMGLFWGMQLEGVAPDLVTIVNVLNCCTCEWHLVHGMAAHNAARERGFDCNIVVGNALITMYNKCGDIFQARSVFDDMVHKDVITWSAMLAAYTSRNRGREALGLFRKLLLDGDATPNRACFVTVLGGFSLEQGDEHEFSHGKFLHDLVRETGHDQFSNVCNSLINMYGVCGSLKHATRVFHSLEYNKDIVSWNAILMLHSQDAQVSKRTIQFYRDMQLDGMKPDKVSFLAILAACTSRGMEKTGRLVHSHVMESESRIFRELDIQNALLNMYGKFGSLEIARSLFDGMQVRRDLSWNGMLVAYSQHGHSREAIQLYHEMLLDGMQANGVTMVGVLSACSHAGMLEQGCTWFGSMEVDHGIDNEIEHYGCMVDLLARAGWLFEAENYFAANANGCSKSWLALLNACKIHGDLDRAGRAAERVIEIAPGTSAGYIILANSQLKESAN